MASQLIVVAGPNKGETFPLTEGETLIIGRGQDSDTHLRDAEVSRKHCQIEVIGGKFMLSDLGSVGGTLVDDVQVTERELALGDVIRLGDTQLRVQSGPSPDQSTIGVSVAAPRPEAAASADQLKNMVGKTIAHYRVEKELAKGVSSVVFLATDTKTDKRVALKVLWPGFSQNEEDMQRFVRAMRTMLSIQHPILIQLYGAGKTGPYCWAAMEYVEGESLTQVIERIGIAGMLDWTYTFSTAVHIARALEAAYEHKVIHRNIKPANIMIRSSDKVAKLGNMMLAKALEGTLAQPQVTRPGELVGDACYMSPEQTRASAGVDTRSDIYSLGATLYSLLTGGPPFEAGSLPELVTKIRQAEPEKPKKRHLSIPEMFQNVVLRMLAKQPEDRYQTPSELLAELMHVAKFNRIKL